MNVGILFRFPPPIEITMPCGQSCILETIEELWQDRPCTCGDPDCWFVKWEPEWEITSGKLNDPPSLPN